MTLDNFKLDPPTLKESGVTLAIQPAPNFVLYRLDGEKGFFANAPEGQRRCDGVLVGKHDNKGVVIFFELKSGDVGDADRQLWASIEYFCQARSETGRQHHSEWQNDDLPGRDHLVYAVLVGSSKRFKRSTFPAKVGGKRIHYRILRRRRRSKPYSFRELLEMLE